MPSLDYDNHVEVRLIKDKPPDPPKGDNGVTFLAVALTVTLPFTFALDLFPGLNAEFNWPQNVQVRWEETPSVSEPPQAPAPPLPANVPETIPSPIPQPSDPPAQRVLMVQERRIVQARRMQVWECNGVYPIAANFRAYPSRSPFVIQGAVLPGDWVTLTGRRSLGDGIVWYEAINESNLTHSVESQAPYQPAARQMGWIASCFVE